MGMINEKKATTGELVDEVRKEKEEKKTTKKTKNIEDDMER